MIIMGDCKLVLYVFAALCGFVLLIYQSHKPASTTFKSEIVCQTIVSNSNLTSNLEREVSKLLQNFTKQLYGNLERRKLVKPQELKSGYYVPNEPLYSEDVIIFLITPTYTRPTQIPELTRMGQTLRLVPNVFWIVVEDAQVASSLVEDLLNRTNIPYVHLLGPRPSNHLDYDSGRGVSNRLKALEWLRENYENTNQKGVIYFADDDNTYDVRLFDEMRDTQMVSMFPVGLINTIGISTPIVSKQTGRIIDFHDPFKYKRKFPVDMAGFAVNLQFYLKSKQATMPYKIGYEEDHFLRSLRLQLSDLEPKAHNCTLVLVWHTKTNSGDQIKVDNMRRVVNYNSTFLPLLYQNLGL